MFLQTLQSRYAKNFNKSLGELKAIPDEEQMHHRCQALNPQVVAFDVEMVTMWKGAYRNRKVRGLRAPRAYRVAVVARVGGKCEILYETYVNQMDTDIDWLSSCSGVDPKTKRPIPLPRNKLLPEMIKGKTPEEVTQDLKETGNPINLKALVEEYFGSKTFQPEGQLHSPVDDAYMTLSLYIDKYLASLD